MKRVTFSILSTVVLLFTAVCFLAAFGFLADNKRLAGQNRFGGYGQLHGTGNPTLCYYHDDTTFYYKASVPSWGRSFNELYAYDLATGESYSVCKRISCTHQTAECPLYHLHQGSKGAAVGYWSIVDSELAVARMTKDKMKIEFWDPLTDRTRPAVEIPRYRTISDGSEYGGKYESFFNDALRLTDDRILIGYNNEMHIYDNSLNDLFFFKSSGLTFPMVVGQKLYWTGRYCELNSVDLYTGEIEENLLDGFFDTKKIVSIWEYNTEFSAFAYNDKIYFPHGETICAFDTVDHTLTKIASIDTLTEDDPYACFGTENVMYYKCHGSVKCMDLDTGLISEQPHIPKVPCTAVGDKLLFVRPSISGTDDIECYDRSDRMVKP